MSRAIAGWLWAGWLACGGEPDEPRAEVLPDPLTVADVATCQTRGDGAVAWFVGDVRVGSGPTLSAPTFARGDLVRCELQDPRTREILAHSAEVAVANAPPIAPSAAMSDPTPRWGVDDLTCVVAHPATDPDGDVVTYTVSWSTPDNPALVGTTEVPLADTLSATLPYRSRSFTCVVTVSDGIDSVSSAPVSASPAPVGGNILFVLLDDVGVDKVGAYGEHADAPPTPNIDALAANGVLFRNAYTSPVCSATRANVMTGRHSRRTGIVDVVDPWRYAYALPGTEVTVPRMLDQSAWFDYAASHVGKWHLGTEADGPLHQRDVGFDWFAGSPGNLDQPPVTDLPEAVGYYAWERNDNGVYALDLTYATVRSTDDAVARIGAMPEPWFLWVAYNAAHTPAHLPPSDLHTNLNLSEGSPAANKYDAMVESLDTEIGRLLANVDPAVLANTHVVIMGDNGTPDYATTPPFDPAFAKGTVHEGGVNVPLIVHGPLVAEPGGEADALVHAVDLFATFADLVGVDPHALAPPEGGSRAVVVDGQSLLPYLADPDRPGARSTLYVEHLRPNGDGPYVSDKRAIRNADFKLIRTLYYGKFVEQLYDLRGRPVESTDLFTLGPLSAEAQAAYDDLKGGLETLATSIAYDVPEHPPQVGTVQVLPPVPVAGDTLTCAVQARDPDGDALSAHYAWWIDGALSKHTGETLPPSAFTAGASVTCGVTADDGQTAVSSAPSAPVIIGT